ncbi:hypothetical protein D3C77_564920 [compost metagenome]
MPYQRMKAHLHAVLLRKFDKSVRILPVEAFLGRMNRVRLHSVFRNQPIQMLFEHFRLYPHRLKRLNGGSNRKIVRIRLRQRRDIHFNGTLQRLFRFRVFCSSSLIVSSPLIDQPVVSRTIRLLMNRFRSIHEK